VTTIATNVWDVVMPRRMALAVECIDSTTRRIITTPVRIEAEESGVSFAAQGVGRAVMSHSRRRTPATLKVRIDDPTRQFAPRRLTIPLWTLAEVNRSFVPAESRLLRPWLLPGSAYPLVRGTTALRGRVETNGAPVRWPRIVARDSANATVGWAHGDERGEFVLVLEIPYVLPSLPDTFDVTLVVSAPAVRAKPSDDPLGDLVVERVLRPLAPPSPTPDEQRLLQGRAIPPGYRTASVPGSFTARLGVLTALDTPVPFPL
jgi:hypothetical protein